MNDVVVGSGATLALNLSDAAVSAALAVSVDPAAALVSNTLLAATVVNVTRATAGSNRMFTTAVVNAMAATVFAVLPSLRATLVATGGNAATGVVALSDTMLLTASVAGLPALPSWLVLRFQFGFMDGGRAMSLAGSVVAPNATSRGVSAVAPLVAELASGAQTAVDVPVFVSVRAAGVALARAESTVNVTVPASFGGTGLATSLVQQAGAATDAASALQLAASMGAFANASGSSVSGAVVAVATIAMLNATLSGGSSSLSQLDATQQGTLLRALRSAMGSVGSASTAAQEQARAVAANLVSSTISGGAFDVGANGGAALDMIAALPAAQSTDLAISLGDVAAQDASIGVGERRELASGGLTITVERFSAGSMGGVTQSAAGGAASLRMPSGFDVTSLGQGVGEASVVGVAATVFGVNAVGAFGGTAPAAGSTVASFSLSASGVGSLVVEQLSEPLTISLGATSGAATCKYWDVGRGAWSVAGVTTQRDDSGAVVCLTTHLTTFGAFGSGSQQTVGASGGNVGAIVGGVLGGVVLFVGIVFFLKRVRSHRIKKSLQPPIEPHAFTSVK